MNASVANPAVQVPLAGAEAAGSDVEILLHTLRRLCSGRDRYQVAVAASHGLTRTEVKALMFIVTDGPLASRKLADLIGVSASAITPTVDKLERRGLARRAGHPRDRRIALVSTTDDGAVVVTHALARLAAGFARLGYDLRGIASAVDQFAEVLNCTADTIDAARSETLEGLAPR